MKLVYGPIPPSETLHAPHDGWTPWRESTPAGFLLAATLLTLPLIATFAWLFTTTRQEMKGYFADHPAALATIVFALLALVPLHEGIHALAYLKSFRSPHLIFGVWPWGGMCYVVYDRPLPRNRVLLMSTAPFLVLSVAPLCLLPWLPGTAQAILLLFALLHTIMCGGDFLVWLALLHQTPRRAWVQNDGWQTFWTLQPPAQQKA
jgi:hypothetical protein